MILKKWLKTQTSHYPVIQHLFRQGFWSMFQMDWEIRWLQAGRTSEKRTRLAFRGLTEQHGVRRESKTASMSAGREQGCHGTGRPQVQRKHRGGHCTLRPPGGALSEAVGLSAVLEDTCFLCLTPHVSATPNYIPVLAPSPYRCSFWLKASQPDSIHPAPFTSIPACLLLYMILLLDRI